jgi:hypothetical protein
MAQLILKGSAATVEFTSGPEDGQTIATCIKHVGFWHPAPPCTWAERYDTLDGFWHPSPPCTWTERYDTLDDAAEYAADHADGRR